MKRTIIAPDETNPNKDFVAVLEIQFDEDENIPEKPVEQIIRVNFPGSILFDLHTVSASVIDKTRRIIQFVFHSKEGFKGQGTYVIHIEQLDDPQIFTAKKIQVIPIITTDDIDRVLHSKDPKPTTTTEAKPAPVTDAKPTLTSSSPSATSKPPIKPKPPAPPKVKRNWGREMISLIILVLLFFVDVLSKKYVQWIIILMVSITGIYFTVKHFEKPVDVSTQKIPPQVDPKTISEAPPPVITPTTTKSVTVPASADVVNTATAAETKPDKILVDPDLELFRKGGNESDGMPKGDPSDEPEDTPPKETPSTPTAPQPQAEAPAKCGACP